MEKPTELKELKTDNLTLSSLIKQVNENYATAYVNKSKLEELQSWIRMNINLFNNTNP